MITKAAVFFQGNLYTGWRHSSIIIDDMMWLFSRYQLEQQLKNDDLGFVDEKGIFYNRHEAAQIAFDCKQTATHCQLLFSEDLWDKTGTPRPFGVPYDPMS